MATTSSVSDIVKGVGVVTTVADALSAFARGRYGSGVFLLLAAAVSSRVPGVGFLASVALRAYRRFAQR